VAKQPISSRHQLRQGLTTTTLVLTEEMAQILTDRLPLIGTYEVVFGSSSTPVPCFPRLIASLTPRKGLKRSDLTGTNGKIITSLSLQEMRAGDAGTLHAHRGEESFYVIEGGIVETPDGKQISTPAGMAGTNRRDVAHGLSK
jgi:hypothetical protein